MASLDPAKYHKKNLEITKNIVFYEKKTMRYDKYIVKR